MANPSVCPSPHQNHLLDAVPASDSGWVASHLELIPLKFGDVLYESGCASARISTRQRAKMVVQHPLHER